MAGGDTLLRAAMAHDIPDLYGICGGACCCASCHVYVEPGPGASLPPVDEMEAEMLDLAEAPLTAHSRLACQVELSDAMGEMVVRIPER